MNTQKLLTLFAVATTALLGLVLNASPAFGHEASGQFPASVPKAICGSDDHTESGLQGQTTVEERSSGDSEFAYNCNLELVGQQPQGAFEGAYSQNGPAYDGDCAYFGTDRVTDLQQHQGITVIDASNPARPRVSMYLNDTAAARAPHETLRTNERRHLLAVAENRGPGLAVYDTSDCRHPKLLANIELPGSSAHHANFSPDGRTYYISQTNRGVGGLLYIVDLADPSHPVMLPTWQFLGDGRPHGAWLNPRGFARGIAEGTRLYAGQPGEFGTTGSSVGPDGLVIEDVSDYQFRRPNPQIRIISKLFWDDQGQAEDMYPVTINGRPYLVSTDEAGGAGGEGGWVAACARGASAFGYPQIIDVSDETNPKIIAKLRLEVNDPANCAQLLAETPPDVPGTAPGTNLPPESGTTNYSNERCVADNPRNAKMLACTFQHASLRIFDVRNPRHPKEIAYWKPAAVRTEIQPSSGSWAAGVDRTIDKIAGYVRWVVVDKNKGHDRAGRNDDGDGRNNWNDRWNDNDHGNGKGTELEIWTVSDGNGFQVLRFTDSFKKRNKGLF